MPTQTTSGQYDYRKQSPLARKAAGNFRASVVSAVQTLDYFPFGDIRVNSKNTSFDTARKYIGQLNDTATNLDYLNAKYYDAARG